MARGSRSRPAIMLLSQPRGRGEGNPVSRLMGNGHIAAGRTPELAREPLCRVAAKCSRAMVACSAGPAGEPFGAAIDERVLSVSNSSAVIRSLSNAS